MPIEIRELIVKTPVVADSFDFTAEGGEDAILIGLLIPAVQKVREAPAQAEPEPVDDFAAMDDDGSDAFFVRVDADTTTQAAEGRGAFELTSLEIGAETMPDDVIVDGTIITAEDWF